MEIISQNLFSLPVYVSQWDGLALVAPELIARIDKLRAEGAGLQASNRHAFHSARDFHLATDGATLWLRAAIVEFAKQALEPRIRSTAPWSVQISSCWAIAADAGGFLVPHNHFPSFWSGVVYLDVEHALDAQGGHEAAAGCLDLLCPVQLAEAFGLAANTLVHPRNGLAVLFPGALQHAVHPHRSEKTRYSVSFNLNIAAA
jgi:uncharacterized protein (TIGR02466 family)